MPVSALGVWLKNLRDRRDLSLRDAAQRAGVDHAYISRLETGEKESPSDEVVDKLLAALGASKRDAKIFRFFVSHAAVDASFAEFAETDSSVTAEELQMLTSVVNRGARADYATSLSRIRRIMGEDDG